MWTFKVASRNGFQPTQLLRVTTCAPALPSPVPRGGLAAALACVGWAKSEKRQGILLHAEASMASVAIRIGSPPSRLPSVARVVALQGLAGDIRSILDSETNGQGAGKVLQTPRHVRSIDAGKLLPATDRLFSLLHAVCATREECSASCDNTGPQFECKAPSGSFLFLAPRIPHRLGARSRRSRRMASSSCGRGAPASERRRMGGGGGGGGGGMGWGSASAGRIVHDVHHVHHACSLR